MAGTKLDSLKQEIGKYLGLPYFSNVGRYQNHGDNSLVGKGSAKEIALKTIEIANLEHVNLLNLSAIDIYKFQKKHHLGIDCSGLVCHLLNFLFGTDLNPRRTSADMLTSSPLAKKISPATVKTGDLVRQKDGRHVLFIVEKLDNKYIFVDSSTSRHGVKYGEFTLTDKGFRHDGFYRLISLPKVPEKSVG